MDTINSDEYLNRTKNHLKSFHNLLNNIIDSFHPRVSHLVEKLKIIVIRKYEEYNDSIKKPKIPGHKKYSLILDIYKFINNYNDKYKTSISPKIIIQGDNEDLSTINKVCQNVVDIFFDIDDNLVFTNQDLDIKIETDKPNIINEDEDSNIEKGKKNFKGNNDITPDTDILIESHYLKDFNKDKKKKSL